MATLRDTIDKTPGIIEIKASKSNTDYERDMHAGCSCGCNQCIQVKAGGPGSGCNGDNCGRPSSGGKGKSSGQGKKLHHTEIKKNKARDKQLKQFESLHKERKSLQDKLDKMVKNAPIVKTTALRGGPDGKQIVKIPTRHMPHFSKTFDKKYKIERTIMKIANKLKIKHKVPGYTE